MAPRGLAEERFQKAQGTSCERKVRPRALRHDASADKCGISTFNRVCEMGSRLTAQDGHQGAVRREEHLPPRPGLRLPQATLVSPAGLWAGVGPRAKGARSWGAEAIHIRE